MKYKRALPRALTLVCLMAKRISSGASLCEGLVTSQPFGGCAACASAQRRGRAERAVR